MILLVGGSGLLGSLIADRLLDDGRRMRLLARHGRERLQPLVDRGADAISGDLKDPASLRLACRGVKTVVTTANSAQRGGVDNLQTVDLEGNRNLIDAAAAAGVRQFVFVSALGATLDNPVPFLQAKARTEQHLRESGVPFTILSPDLFMEVWVGMIVVGPVAAGQPVTLVGEGRRRHSFVSTADVAAFAAAAVRNPQALGQQIVIGGPEAVSWRDVAAAAGRVLGRDVPVRSIPPGEPLPGLPEVVTGLATALEMYDSVIDMRETARAFGVRLTGVESYLQRALGALAPQPASPPVVPPLPGT